jgi:TonB family protein
MRRRLLHILVALLAFAFGFLFAAPYEYLAYALPLAFLVFVIAKIAPALDVDVASLCVVAASLLFLSAGIYATFAASEIFYGGSCGVDFSGEDDTSTLTSCSYPSPVDSEGARGENFGGIAAYTCGSTMSDDTMARNSIWAGVINGKALFKPAPVYPSFAKTTRLTGTVAVSVLVDESGRVTQAQAVSGHILLRQSAMEAACRALFHPAHIDGPPLRVSGILTYKFDL